MREFKVKILDKIKKKIVCPEAITFDVKTLAPFAVKIPGRTWDTTEKYLFLQWTGLLDINQSEVYEGDIVTINCDSYFVVWNASAASYELVNEEGSSMRHIKEVSLGCITGNHFLD